YAYILSPLYLIPLFLLPLPPRPPRFPYTTLFRSRACSSRSRSIRSARRVPPARDGAPAVGASDGRSTTDSRSTRPRGHRLWRARSEEHTSELQSRFDLVCRLLLEKKNTTWRSHAT